MDRETLIKELKDIIGDYLSNQGLDFVDFDFRREGRGLILRILVDKPQGGINLEECANLNIQISRILDEKDILQERYLLEVSSPGVDRPLKVKADFLRCLDKRVRVFLKEEIEGRFELEGVIKRIEDESVYFEVEGGIVEVPYFKISQAKQLIG